MFNRFRVSRPGNRHDHGGQISLTLLFSNSTLAIFAMIVAESQYYSMSSAPCSSLLACMSPLRVVTSMPS